MSLPTSCLNSYDFINQFQHYPQLNKFAMKEESMTPLVVGHQQGTLLEKCSYSWASFLELNFGGKLYWHLLFHFQIIITLLLNIFNFFCDK